MFRVGRDDDVGSLVPATLSLDKLGRTFLNREQAEMKLLWPVRPGHRVAEDLAA